MKKRITIPKNLKIDEQHQLNNLAAEIYDASLDPYEKILLSQFTYRLTDMIMLCEQFSAARDLLRGNPVLLWLLTGSMNIARRERKDIELLLQGKQHELLAMLFDSGGKITVRVLNKLELKLGDRREYMVVNRAATSGLLAQINHWERIPVMALEILNDCPVLQHSRHFQWVAESEGLPELLDQDKMLLDARDLWGTCVRIASKIKRDDYETQLAKAKTSVHLLKIRSQWLKRYALMHSELEEHQFQFPLPPIPGSEHIIPIRDVLQLFEEGLKLHHCSSVYAKDVSLGKSYLYEVTHPQRGTLKLDITASGPVISDFKLACNAEPSQESYRAVNAWFRSWESQRTKESLHAPSMKSPGKK